MRYQPKTNPFLNNRITQTNQSATKILKMGQKNLKRLRKKAQGKNQQKRLRRKAQITYSNQSMKKIRKMVQNNIKTLRQRAQDKKQQKRLRRNAQLPQSPVADQNPPYPLLRVKQPRAADRPV